MNTEKLPKKEIKISPSLMCADFLHLQDQLAIFEEREIEYLHIDIMDGHYVPNFTLGPGFCKVLSRGCSIPLDVHLMIENVDKYIPVFAEAI
ncbi:MAG: ribulose-phosphate 3-epimerase, partial [Spirochaetia bacterium]